ncbi:uncharacterized protein BDZ99DRAFT_482761 [Mytilinidion resinicola]|uniref:Uncharacterized protein n=1 Tax=Mytilinidion resinicola TaxID=574789 RepID=A0A6A6Y245_9PEZI|nr:uncharacterized protein BDZ99DRAFT_482761 [Mytilinidion resinicola]KAF2802628.1 hypothetical protein BDZ99DRAFT_482761 [Mytilinidion resinicola]
MFVLKTLSLAQAQAIEHINHIFAKTMQGNGSNYWHSAFTPTVVDALSGVQSVSLFLQVRGWLASGFRHDFWDLNSTPVGRSPAWNDHIQVYGLTRLRLLPKLRHVNVALYSRPDAVFDGLSRPGWIHEPVADNDREIYVRSLQELLCAPWDDASQRSYEESEMKELPWRISWQQMMRHKRPFQRKRSNIKLETWCAAFVIGGRIPHPRSTPASRQAASSVPNRALKKEKATTHRNVHGGRPTALATLLMRLRHRLTSRIQAPLFPYAPGDAPTSGWTRRRPGLPAPLRFGREWQGHGWREVPQRRRNVLADSRARCLVGCLVLRLRTREGAGRAADAREGERGRAGEGFGEAGGVRAEGVGGFVQRW